MPVCSLFLKQYLTRVQPSQYPEYLALPDQSTDPQAFDVALAAAGIGIRPVCALPRFGGLGGYPGSNGNTANIVLCSIAFVVGLVLAWKAGRRQAAVARWEMRAFYIIFALQSLFQALSTGEPEIDEPGVLADVLL